MNHAHMFVKSWPFGSVVSLVFPRRSLCLRLYLYLCLCLPISISISISIPHTCGMTSGNWYDLSKDNNRRTSYAKHPVLWLSHFCHDLICTRVSAGFSHLSMCVYIHIYILYVYMYMYVYIYIYTYNIYICMCISIISLSLYIYIYNISVSL